MTQQNTQHENEGAMERERFAPNIGQMGAGGVIVLAALVLGWGAWQVPAPLGRSDGGAALWPSLCAGALLLCGLCLVWEAWQGGWRLVAAASERGRLQLTPWAWVSAGILLGALLLPYSGFVLAAALCYVLALQGLRGAAPSDRPLCAKRVLADVLIGLVVAALVYLLFVWGLGLSLPVGWLPWM